MAIVYKGRKRRWRKEDHPRNPDNGEFIEKTGGHASWLMRIAERTQGPNVGGKVTPARAGYGPTNTGRVPANDLRRGDHARVAGMDSTGKPMTLNGYVQAAGPVNVRQRGRKTPMIAVQVAETPSGGGANWRGTVYVEPHVRIQRTQPKSSSADVLTVAGFGDDRIEAEISAAERDLAALASNAGATVRRLEIQERLNTLRKERTRRRDAEGADSTSALQQRISDQIGGQRGGKLDTPRAKRDDSGMAPTTPKHTKPGAQLLADLADKLEKDFPDAAKERTSWRGTDMSTVAALRAIAQRHEAGELNKGDTVAAVSRLAINLARDPEGGAVSAAVKALKKTPARAPKASAPQAPKTHAERVQETIAAYHSSFAPVVTPPTTAKKAFTPARDPDPNSREGFALSLRQLPGAALHGTAAELEAGDLTPREAADRLSQFLRSPAARAMSQSDRRGFGVLEGRMRAADRAALGLDRPAPTPPANSYNSITKRATLLAMLRTRGLKAKRGAPDDDLRRILAEDDQRRAAGGDVTPPAGAEARVVATKSRAVDQARTVESLASMKRPALLAVARQNGVKLRRGAPEREIAEAIVARREANTRATMPNIAAARDAEVVRTITPREIRFQEHFGARVRITQEDRFGRGQKSYEGHILEARADGDHMSMRLSDAKGLLWVNWDAQVEVLEPRPDTPAFQRLMKAVEADSRAQNDVSAAKYANTRPTQSNEEVRARGIAETASRERYAAEQAVMSEITGANDLHAARRAFERAGVGSSVDDAARSLAASRVESTMTVEQADAEIRTILTQLSAPGARAAMFRSLAMGHGDNEPVAKRFRDAARKAQDQADAKLANDFADRVNARSGPKARTEIAIDRVRVDYADSDDPASRVIRNNLDGVLIRARRRDESEVGEAAGEVRRMAQEQPSGSADRRKLNVLATELERIAGTRPTSEQLAAQAAAPRPESHADVFRRHSQLTRAQFEAMPADARERILDELRAVRDSGEQQPYTNRGTRSNLGITSRGLRDASWVSGAKEKIRELTYVAPPPVDNSIAGRAARLRAGDASAVYGATIEQMRDAAVEAGLWGPGNWKRPKVEKFILDQLRMGDRRPANTGNFEVAKAMRGADKTQALAILEAVEATEKGLTKADMRQIADQLGVRLRNGDSYTMKNALAAAAKEAPGKA